jgi:threonine/homoserine/homoserine lactone efflux protein
MEPGFFLKGAAIGFSIAAPVGPIGVLCIRRTVRDGFPAGLLAGLGAATADAAYGCVAGFGMTAISGFLVRRQSLLGLVGGLFLCFIGARAFFAKTEERAATSGGDRLLSVYGSTLFLTLSNPSTILSFAAVFAGFGLGMSADYGPAAALVLGVFLGSSLWWLFLSGCVGMLRSRVDSRWMEAINRVSGVVLFSFGIYALHRSLA